MCLFRQGMVKNIIKEKFKNKRKPTKRSRELTTEFIPAPAKRLRAVAGMPNYAPVCPEDSNTETIAAANQMRKPDVDVEVRRELMQKTFAWIMELTVTKNKTPT